MAQVTLRKVVKKYDEVLAVRGIDLDITDKEFIVLVGPSGCGKSTTLRMIAGLEEISGGDIAIGGDVVHATVANVQVAAGDLLEAGDHAQGGALAAARRSDQYQEFLVPDLNVQVAHGGDFAVLLGDVVQRDASHIPGSPSLPAWGGAKVS